MMLYPFYLVGNGNDGEYGIISKAIKTIEDFLQVRVNFYFFQAKFLTFHKFDDNEKADCNS